MPGELSRRNLHFRLFEVESLIQPVIGMRATFVCTTNALRANALRASRNPLHRFEEARFVLEVDARRQHPRCPILNGDLGMSRFQAAYNNLTRYGPVSKIAKGYKSIWPPQQFPGSVPSYYPAFTG